MALRVVTPPATGILTLDEAKAHLRVSFTDDDADINDLILDATALVEAETQRRYIAQTLEWVREGWGEHLNPFQMCLPVAPGTDSQEVEINSIRYVDENGTTQVLDPSIYWSRPSGPTRKIVKRWFVIWPWLGDGAERVVINFTLGGTVDEVPRTAKRAAKLLVSHWYQNRDAVVGVEQRDSSTPLPLGFEATLSPERWNR